MINNLYLCSEEVGGSRKKEDGPTGVIEYTCFSFGKSNLIFPSAGASLHAYSFPFSFSFSSGGSSTEQMSKKAPPRGDSKKSPQEMPLAQQMHVDTDLRRLYEASNQVGDEIVPFMKRVKAELARVKDGDQEGLPQLSLFISERIPYNDARLLFNVILPPYAYLRNIQLHHCGLDDDSMLFLVEFVKSYKPTPDRNPFGICVLELPGSNITARGAGYLGKMLSENSTIDRLVMDFSPLGDDGIRALCDGLRWNGTLKYLSLDHCGLTSVGTEVIASRVLKGSNVTYLSLQGNLLEGEGIKEIGRALGVGTKIEYLNLADTGFGFFPDAIDTLCEGIENSTSLSVINLEFNTLASSGPISLLTAIKKNRRIVSMRISERVDSQIYNEILDVLAEGEERKIKQSIYLFLPVEHSLPTHKTNKQSNKQTKSTPISSKLDNNILESIRTPFISGCINEKCITLFGIPSNPFHALFFIFALKWVNTSYCLVINPKPSKKPDKQAKYRLLPLRHAAVVQEASIEDPPEEEEIKACLQSLACKNSAPFIIRCDGVIDNTVEVVENEEEDFHTEREPTLMEKLLEHIEACVGKRENVTIINRGVRSDSYLEQLVLQLFKAIKPSAEHGMQVVADEIAKERQMQRLLQLEADEEQGAADLNQLKNEANREHLKNQGLPLSSKLAQKLKELQKEFPYTSAQVSKYAERFTLLSAAHGDELLPPCKTGSCLVPQSFITNPPVYRSGVNNQAGHEATLRSSAHVYSKMRRATTTVMGELEGSTEMVEEVAPLEGNGWGANISFYKFNGESSIMALPGVPKFEEIIKSFGVDFWLRTDCKVSEGKKVLIQIMESREDVGQLFSLTLNWYPEQTEAFRLFIRDSQNRVLEGVVPLHETEVTSGEHFHHIMIRIHNLDECIMECIIDGEDHQFQFLQQEHPIGFNSWPHRLFIGGFLDDNHAPTSVFRGSMMELRFWSGGENPQPIIRWPLMVRDGPLIELTKTIPEDHHETLQNLIVAEEPAPRSAPLFDGRLVVNMGPLPLWGQLMHNWRMEIRFRTTCSTRLMTLVGVTDRKFKMQQIGIALNAEPISSKERFRFHELNVTFYVVDCFGACCSALLRGTDRENLMDGEWHTIVWRCVDVEQNNFMVIIDGVQQNLLFVSREGPNRFTHFDDWVCLGGHNVRSWKTQREFEGSICRFYLSLRGHRYVTLEMNEGPGAYVLQDLSGHRNHGLLIHSQSNAVRRNDVTWVPVPPERHDDDDKKVEIISYRNNSVAIAAVVFTGEFDENLIPHEVIYDVFKKKESTLEMMDHHICDPRPQWGNWACISENCFRPLENVTQLEEALNEVLAAEMPTGHLMVVVRIGDCHVTLVQLHNMELPPEAVYNTNMLKWHYPFGFEGHHGRRELMLHRMLESVEKVLVADTLTPFTTAKLGPLNSGSTTIVSQKIVQSLKDNGKPWYLPAVLHNHLLNTEYGSHLHVIHRFGATMSFDEAAALCMFNKKLFDRCKEVAAMVIQRNWRGKMGKDEAFRRDGIRKIKNLKVEEIRNLRMDPEVHAKEQLKAIFITLHNVKCEGVPNIKASVSELEDTLIKQGYEVQYVVDPDPAKLLTTLSDLSLDSSSFVYLSGYGGQLNIRQAPLLSLQGLHVSLEEGAARAKICHEEGHLFRGLMTQCVEEGKNVKSKKKKKKDKKKAAPPRGKNAQEEFDAMQKQMEQLFQEALMEVDRDENFLRDSMMKEYEGDVAAITNEMRLTIYATNKFLKKFKPPASNKEFPPNFIYPSMCSTIEPYSSVVLNVEDVINIALSRENPIIGFQRVIAIDLQPITPYACGFACIASSTGNTLRFSYKPQQRRFLSWTLKKAFDGHAPAVPAVSKYAVLSGGIETAENQRDWKSFASYITTKMKPACSSAAEYAAQVEELQREKDYTADLVPIRDIVVPAEVRDRRRRDREGGKVAAALTFGVGSTKVQNDMFAFFKNIVDGLPLTEIVFTNTINILFEKSNKNIDAILESDLIRELEKCRPNNCTVQYSIAITCDGAKVTFEAAESLDKMSIGQWISSIVVRSLSWKIGTKPSLSYAMLDVNYIEYVYHIKTNCKLRQFRHLKKQLYLHPVPEPYVRFLDLEEVIGGPPPKLSTLPVLATNCAKPFTIETETKQRAMKLVRRARKSIKERRMKACINDLNANLAKVETKVFLQQKGERDKKRKAMGLSEPVPKDILTGRMNPDLYAIECRLHNEVGLPRPHPYPEYWTDMARLKKTSQRIGFVDFRMIIDLKTDQWEKDTEFALLTYASPPEPKKNQTGKPVEAVVSNISSSRSQRYADDSVHTARSWAKTYVA
eukprot:gene12054-8306_t